MKFFEDKFYRKVAIGIGGIVAFQLIVMTSVLPGILLLSACGFVDLKSMVSNSLYFQNLTKPLFLKSILSTAVPFPSVPISDASLSSTSFDSSLSQTSDHLTEKSLLELNLLLDRLELDSTTKFNFLSEILKHSPPKRKGNDNHVVAFKMSAEQSNNDSINKKSTLKTESIKISKNNGKSYASVLFSIFFSSISYVGLATFFYSWLLGQKKELGALRLIVSKNLILDVNRLSSEVATISKSFSPEGLDVLRTDLSSLQDDMTKITEIQNKQEENYKKLQKDTTDFPFIVRKYLDLRQNFDRVTRGLTPQSSSPSISSLSSASPPCSDNNSVTESPISVLDDTNKSKGAVAFDGLEDSTNNNDFVLKEAKSDFETKKPKDSTQNYLEKESVIEQIRPLNQTRMVNLKLHSLPNHPQVNTINSFGTRQHHNTPLNNNQRTGRYNGHSSLDHVLSSSNFQELNSSKYGSNAYRLSHSRSGMLFFYIENIAVMLYTNFYIDRLTNTQRNNFHNNYGLSNSSLPKVTRLSPNIASVIKTLGSSSSSSSSSPSFESTLHQQSPKLPLIPEKIDTPDLIFGAEDEKELSASLSTNQLENKSYQLSDNSTTTIIIIIILFLT